MSISVKGGAAPLSGGAGPVVTPHDALSMFSSRMGFAQPQVPDPRRDVQESVGQLPRVVPQMSTSGVDTMLDPGAAVTNMQDVANYSGSEFLPTAEQQVVLDQEGRVIPGAGDRGPAMMGIGVNAYDQSLIDQQGGFADIREPMARISADPSLNAQEGLTDLFARQEAAAANAGNARQELKSTTYGNFDDAKSYVDRAGSTLTSTILGAQETLFTDRTKAAAYVDPSSGQSVPVGIKVLNDMGLLDETNARIVSTVAGIGLSQAISQIGVHNANETKAGQPPNNQLGGDKDFMSNVINATSSFMKNGFRNMGFKIDSPAVEYMAKAMVYDAVNRGDMIYSTDPDTGNAVLEAGKDRKESSKQLQRASEAMVGNTTRLASSTSPNASGTSFRAGRPELTKKSLYSAGIVTSAADAAKNIMGSVGFVFRRKDLQRKMAELQMVFNEKFVKTGDLGEFQYSTHPLAKRNGVDEGAWLAAKHNTEVPQNYDHRNPDHKLKYEQQQVEAAQKVMQTKKADIEFTMKSIANKAGIRYGHYIHSTANQRFFVNSYDLDWMGSKNIIRDVLGLAYQDVGKANSLFDPKEIMRIQDKAVATFRNTKGEALHKKLEALTPTELGTIGAMHSAVLYYYSAIEPKHELSKGISRRTSGEIVSLFRPEMANKLAELGEKYNAYLADPTSEPDPEMMSFWAAAEKGEAMGVVALWDDFFTAKSAFDDPATKASSVPFTHHAFYDGNQNGIFLQSLLFGMESASSNGDAVIRLSSPNPRLLDMREMGMNTMIQVQGQQLSATGDFEQQEGWRNFWKEAANLNPDGMAGVARDFFKEPLMQNAYGKDASMFSDVMFRLLEANRLYSDLFKKHLQDTGIYNDATSAAGQLSEVVEVTLRQIIDSNSVSVLKKAGRYSALVNSAIHVPGPSGDTMVISPVGMAPVNKKHGNPGAITYQEINGKRVLRKTPSYVTDTITDPATGKSIDIPSYELQQMPSASVGTVMHLNRATMKYDPFDNPYGMSLSRQLGVLLVQSLDGDLVKWATIETNKDRKIPRPVMWVHDSIISTGGHGLIYANMYNNIAIPAMIPKLKPMAKKIRDAIRGNVEREIELVKTRGEPVGIGAEGDYPALGALFDDYVGKINVADPKYKDIFIKMEKTRQASRKPSGNINKTFDQRTGIIEGKSPEEKWIKYRREVDALLKEAEAAGWVDPGEFPQGDTKSKRYLAVTPDNFAKLVKIAGRLLQMEGATNRLDNWANMGEQRVTNAEKVLHSNSAPGIVQMAGSIAKAPSQYDPKELPPEELASYKASKRKADILAERMRSASLGATEGEKRQQEWMEKNKPKTEPVPGEFDPNAPF